MGNRTQREKDQAEKKCNIAIDKMIDLQDMGFGNEKIQRILDSLNELRSCLNNE
jgi:flagellin-specific chaperone FliS